MDHPDEKVVLRYVSGQASEDEQDSKTEYDNS